MAMKYFIKTFGCQQNERDSEIIEDYYQSRGFILVKELSKADVIIINTCSVRQSAEHRVFGLINNINKLKVKSAERKTKAKSLKLKRPRIILTGCMIGLYEKKFLEQKLPAVYQFKEISDWRIKGLSKQGYVSIMSGCNNFCSYCVVPYARGKEVSRPIEEIVDEVKKLVKKGITEITLLGQNVNSYGKDVKNFQFFPPIAGSRCGGTILNPSTSLRTSFQSISKFSNFKTPFAVLLQILNEINGIKKISFMTSNPWDLDEEIIEAMSLPKIDRYLHLPVQSGDDEILKRMNRKYTARQYLKLIKQIRKKIPEIEIGTDIIVGFPGETDEQFNNTVLLCRKVGFNRAFISKYSPRPKTVAFKLKDDVSVLEKKRRWQILEKLINQKKSSS